MAAELSAATAREVTYVDVPDQQAKHAMIHEGLSDFFAQQILNVYVMLRKGVSAQVTSTVESLTGKPPRDFAAFARDHAHRFAPVAVGARR